ncbi:MAG: Trp biosynthesis-associated membrane protein [Humibacillus sp.]|nr:Trp biosynthesis-associated membrane protein [Humibacillus sp.]MDN5777562.1 Trp biosynthesis-associated membrane protein [Humibacillus sp.]
MNAGPESEPPSEPPSEQLAPQPAGQVDEPTEEQPARQTSRRLGKRGAALAVLLPAVALLGLATRPWASGRARDVLTSGVTEVSGSTAAPGMVGVALVAVVALLGMMTGGRVIRAVSAAVLVVAAVGALAFTAMVVAQPVQAVGEAVARQLARTTAPETVASTTVWAWLGLVAAVLLTVGAVAASVSSRSWAGLSSRYERAAKPASGERGPRGQVRTPWDELSEGGDPTLRDPTPRDGTDPT